MNTYLVQKKTFKNKQLIICNSFGSESLHRFSLLVNAVRECKIMLRSDCTKKFLCLSFLSSSLLGMTPSCSLNVKMCCWHNLTYPLWHKLHRSRHFEEKKKNHTLSLLLKQALRQHHANCTKVIYNCSDVQMKKPRPWNFYFVF